MSTCQTSARRLDVLRRTTIDVCPQPLVPKRAMTFRMEAIKSITTPSVDNQIPSPTAPQRLARGPPHSFPVHLKPPHPQPHAVTDRSERTRSTPAQVPAPQHLVCLPNKRVCSRCVQRGLTQACAGPCKHASQPSGRTTCATAFSSPLPLTGTKGWLTGTTGLGWSAQR